MPRFLDITLTVVNDFIELRYLLSNWTCTYDKNLSQFCVGKYHIIFNLSTNYIKYQTMLQQ